MEKVEKVTLVARTLLKHGGRMYGDNHQFVVDSKAEADKLIASGQAALAPPKKGAATPAAAPVAAPAISKD